MDARLYPISKEFFNSKILPIITDNYIWKGRPPKIDHYQVFCAILYVLRTGVPWRDLPKCFGKWHSIYTRFVRGGEKGLWWKILMKLQQQRSIKMNVVLCDSSTFKFHRHGGGLKKGFKLKEGVSQV